ncbi:MAG TPA: bifunctional diaminohydroxyphosphoribosylaminopyrimidine deaminase/5-amino-6-(5-phosphoribosylamino)uracil reductase RibD [Silvibacterium sp.]|nr:bifunctional diaminohydroxyphosphoribosylaminopyrimidine deaminase/5-amino-6-(5-phosphoribosylamino)uracil reductase RibD [Silvibacterium sp.]
MSVLDPNSTHQDNPAPKHEDERWMSEALDQGRQSVGVASPNPAVGCVLVKGDTAVGRGFHEYDRLDHAEVVALKAAGGEARGATAYVTLEPCCYTGRTGPCTEALIEAGVARVVVATGDPNPAVSGQGIQRLRAAGITVDIGVLAAQAQELNDGFARYIQSRLPFVTLKAGLSLDGRSAPAPGTTPVGVPVMLTGVESRMAVQNMRHAADALITGINTVLTDNPLLSDRTGLPRRRRLLRVVLDSALRLRLDSKLVRTVQDDVLVFCTISMSERQRALEALGVRVERVEAGPGGARVSLRRVIERLGEMEIISAMIEGGSQLASSALGFHTADKLSLFYSPIFLGAAGVPLFNSTESIKPDWVRTSVRRIGQDFWFEGYLRDPWANTCSPD